MGSPVFRRVLTGLLLLIATTIFGVMWMAGGVQSPRRFPNLVEHLSGEAKTSTSGLSVVSWNIAWGYGWGSEGSGGAKERAHFDRSIAAVAEILKKVDADVVLLQEVDFRSTRSHKIDQARTLAAQAGYPFVVRAESWRANWVPFPYWPIQDHFGRMSSGGAILSRYPLSDAEVVLFEKPGNNPFWYNLFYLFRYAQTARAILPGRTVTLVNTHLEAFDRENREAQARELSAQIRPAARQGSVIVGGDLNSVPPESTVKSGYEDEPESSHEDERTVSILRSTPGLADALSVESFLRAEEAAFTFPAHAPNRKLDFVFGSEDLEVLETRVVREAGTISDHLPIFARFGFPEPEL